MGKITLTVDTDKQALKDFYITAMPVLNQIQSDADNLQTANLNNLAQAVAALKQAGKAVGQLAQGLEILLKGIKNKLT